MAPALWLAAFVFTRITSGEVLDGRAAKRLLQVRAISLSSLAGRRRECADGTILLRQCNHLERNALQRIVLGTNVTRSRIASALPNRYVKVGASKSQGMLNLSNEKSGGCARWCALVVLTAVFALAVSVATRYSSAAAVPTSAVRTSHSYSAQPPGRQRLTKDAANWVPPTINCLPWQAPARPVRVPSVKSAIPNLSFASLIFYRPPPVSPSFA